MFGSKKKIELGIIVGENSNRFLSFDEYAHHYLLPFSPRFCCIDFAVSSLSSAGIEDIVVFAGRDKEIILNYLVKNWPNKHFTVFDYVDIREKFVEFFNEYDKSRRPEKIAIIRGNYPAWLDLKTLENEIGKQMNLSVRAAGFSGFKTEHGALRASRAPALLIVEKKLFVKKCEDVLLDENNLDTDMVAKITGGFKFPAMEIPGLVIPFGSLKEYYEIHMRMITEYPQLDRFNAQVPVRGKTSLAVSSIFGKSSTVINSIFGENVDIQGRVENSVIFSNVKIGRNALVKNSIVFPGNHIGGKAMVQNSMIDEFSGDSTIANIEHGVVIGEEHPSKKNTKHPGILGFGVTLIGKDAHIPAGAKIGANCFVDSFVAASDIKVDRKISDGSTVGR